MDNKLPVFLLTNEIRVKSGKGKEYNSLPFIDRTLKGIAGFIVTGYTTNDTAHKNGWLQSVHAWAKVLFLLGFIVVISIKNEIYPQLLFTFFLFFLYWVSKINLFGVYKRIFLIGFIFGFCIIVPASLNIITKGRIWIPLIKFETDSHFWIYSFPETIGITYEGCAVVLRFWLKVINSLATTLLIIHTTPFTDIIKSLKILRVPDLLLLTITLTYKFLFILSRTTEEAYLALKARWWRRGKTSEDAKIIAGRISFIFRKSWIKYEEIYMAMTSRGFSGKVMVVLNEKIAIQDVFFLLTAIMVVIIGFII
jgi:cobalt ECF transporter T component CbiQ